MVTGVSEALIPVTVPLDATDATEGLEECQTRVSPVSVELPTRESVLPSRKYEEEGETATLATTTSAVALNPVVVLVAVMVTGVLEVETPVTIPEAFTVAMEVFDELQV